jgi:hypothetical protein
LWTQLSTYGQTDYSVAMYESHRAVGSSCERHMLDRGHTESFELHKRL